MIRIRKKWRKEKGNSVELFEDCEISIVVASNKEQCNFIEFE